MDGLEATRLLKKADATRHIKVVALTAFAMKGDEEKMSEVGCVSYYAKPIQYKHFLDEVEKMLSMNFPKEERHDHT